MNPRSSQFSAVSILLLVLFSSNCSQDSADLVETTLVDGVRLTRYMSYEPPAVNPYDVVAGPVYGQDQGIDSYLFSSAVPVGVTKGGVVLICDFREMQIHRFELSGMHLGTIGGRGQGPGEYLQLSPPAFDGNLLYIVDHANARLTVLNADGQVIVMTRLKGGEFPGSRFTVYGPPEKRGFIAVDVSTSRDPETMIPRYRHLHITLLDADLNLVSTPTDSVLDRPWTLLRGDLSLMVIPPFENISAVVALKYNCPIAWSFGEAFRVDCLDPLTAERWAFQIPHEAAPVTDHMIEDNLSYWNSRGLLEVARREIKYPKHLPHIQEMMWDDVRRLWVQEYKSPKDESGVYRFYVFSSAGERLFRQDLPVQPIIVAEDVVYAQSEDESGNPVVTSFQLVRR